jgi:hypothetical protein
MRRALPIAAALLVGLLAGHLLAPAPHPSPTTGPAAPGPTRQGAGGIGVGYAHSPKGALAAATGYQQALATPAILRPGQLEKRISQVAAPSYAQAMVAANRPGTRRLAEGVLGTQLREGVPTAFFCVPVYYRLLHYTPRRAVIAIWGFTVVGNATLAEPAAYFGSSQTTLAWLQGDWKIARTRAAFGPTPKLLTPRRGGEGFGVIDLIRGWKRYALAP